MHLHEFQAKELLAQLGFPIPRGRIASSGLEAGRVAERLGLTRSFVKAQILAGDRAANGGVRFASSPDEVSSIASELIGSSLVTSQTGPAGQQVRWVYVEEAVEFLLSFYCAAVVDRAAGDLKLIASRRGETGIKASAPGASHSISLRLTDDGGVAGDFDRVANALCPPPEHVSALAERLSRLAHAAVALDASLVEISPLVLSRDGTFVALDAKIVLDGNALFRHPDLTALRDFGGTEDGDPAELAADRNRINYLRLDGDIGVVVNGAGLALATLDLLQEAGGRAANFMDIRTTATSLDVAYAFQLIAANPRVRAVLVNVHGGGMQRCDTIADGIGIGAHRTRWKAPIVVRLAGNNAEFAVSRFKTYGVPIVETQSMWEAASMAVQLAKREAA